MITDDHYNELDKLLKTCMDHDDLLTDWENDFVSDFVNKLGEYGEKINVSEKQQAVFDRLQRKLEHEGVL